MIILDLDGPLADFHRAAFIAHGQPFHPPEEWHWYRTQWQMDDDTFWKRIHQHGDSFYKNVVQPQRWARQLLDMVRRTDKFMIASAASSSNEGTTWEYGGKRAFMYTHFPEVPTEQITVLCRKELLANCDPTGVLLIDDSAEQCANFAAAGGSVFLFPMPHNTKPYPPSGNLDWGELETVLERWKVRGSLSGAVPSVTDGVNPYA